MNKEKIIKVGTFFSGIGSPEKALQKLKDDKYIKDYKLEFFSEIDKNAIKSYCAIHNVDESLNIGSIVDVKGINLPYCDLWIGGFPCQDISCAGKMNGFESASSTRSSLGWEMIRLLKEVKEKPKYVIFENVAMITSKLFIDTLNLFKQELINLGYTLYDKLLCATDFEIPQTRTRYFLVAILNNEKKFEFPQPINQKYTLQDFLDKNVDEEYYLTNNDYMEIGNKRIFKNIKRNDIVYEVDINKYLSGGICGIDKHTKFKTSARLFSENGNISTLTACNTADNSKVVVED